MSFVPGKTWVRTSGQWTGPEEISLATEAVKSEWWTASTYTKRFEQGLWDFLGRKALFCNSGSSANLLAMSALARTYLKPGDPVITPAMAFPTTVSAIYHAGLRPVFVDVELKTFNMNVGRAQDCYINLKRQLGHDRIGVFAAHTLGNPWDVTAMPGYVVEDNCDALGAEWDGQKTGTMGIGSTCSFYPAHQITTGEGGAVFSNDEKFLTEAESFRDWGRDCWCPPGCQNTCGKRFDGKHGALPEGYDHKYVYRNLGYNLKATDIQAAIGLAQLPKLRDFVELRRANWQRLMDGMGGLVNFFRMPDYAVRARPSWFGFALTVLRDAPFTRADVLRFLHERRIDTRLMFGGNVLRQPAFLEEHVRWELYGDLMNTDTVCEQTFWVGCWPGLTNEMLDYVIQSLHDFVKERT